MTFASKHGSTNNRFKADTTGRQYYNLRDLYESNGAGCVYVLDCLFINTKGQYGDQPVAGVCTEAENSRESFSAAYLVNLPSHLCAKVREICSDPESVNDINNMKAGFKIYTYTPKGSSRICYSVDWVDIDMPF